jgi:hypothetical protein
MIIDLLIVDEVESLLSQLTGGVCRKTNAHESFLRMIKTSKHVIVMDGFL